MTIKILCIFRLYKAFSIKNIKLLAARYCIT